MLIKETKPHKIFKLCSEARYNARLAQSLAEGGGEVEQATEYFSRTREACQQAIDLINQ